MRTQGSLEYLIIIAVVLAVSAIVIMYTTGIIGGQKSSVSISSCKQAAIDCKLSKMSSPTDQCLSCDTACKDFTGTEVFNGATYCCNHAQSDLIYTGSPGCGGGYSNYGSRTDIYFDHFNDFSGWTGQSTSGPCTDTSGWCIGTGQTGNGANMSSHGTYTITRAQPTVGYSNIQLSFQALTCGEDGTGGTTREYMKVDWSSDGGSTWTNLLDQNRIVPWALESYTLPASADENPKFVVRITAYDTHVPEDTGSLCAFDFSTNPPTMLLSHSQIDEFRITGLQRL